MSVYRINEKSVKVCVCVCGSGCELCKNRQFLQFSPNVEEIIFSSIWHVIDFGSGMFLWVMFISMFIFFNLILVAPNKSIPHIRHFDIIIWERTVKREKELAANRWGKRQNPRKQMREERKKESFAPPWFISPSLKKVMFYLPDMSYRTSRVQVFHYFATLMLHLNKIDSKNVIDWKLK